MQLTNKFNNSIGFNVKVRKSSYTFNDLTVRKRAIICNRSTRTGLLSLKKQLENCYVLERVVLMGSLD